MGVMMDFNYRLWNAKTQTSVVGWPLKPAACLRIAENMREYQEAGISVVRLPPSTRGGAGQFSDGYDKYDDYDIDGTAFGSGEDLRRCVAAARAYGLGVYGDLVLHQYGGGKGGVYPTKRFPKHPPCFVGPPPGVVVDDVPDQSGNFAFGDMASYQHSTPAGYMHDGAIAAAEWLTATADFDGYRIDDVKGTYAPVVYDMFHTRALGGLYAFGEYFDGNPSAISNWVNGYMHRRCGVLDFAFKFNVGNICNNNSRIWMGQLADIGWCTKDAATAVTFVESADTDNSPGEQVIWNKMLGYAIMLTFPGYPAIYYRDWATDPGCYGLKPWINNLIWIHEFLAQGDFVPRLDWHPQVFVHERMGFGSAPGCIAAFNNDQYNEYTVTVQTRYEPNTRLHEYTGKYDTDVWTDAQGRITITLPPNDNGMAYLVFGLWVSDKDFSASRPILTQQTFFGAADLGTEAQPGLNTVGRIYAAVGTGLSSELNIGGVVTYHDPRVSFLDPEENPVTYPAAVAKTGYYSVQITLPDDAAPTDYALTVEYMGA